MEHRPIHTAKITRPGVSGILPRKRLYSLLDESRGQPVIWMTAPGGYGKTTLVADYLDSRKLSCLWYQVDKGDDDPATFFYYMGLAAKKAAPRYRSPLPLLTPEYLLGLPTFTLRYFEEVYKRVQVVRGSPGPFFIILDNYQEVPASSMFHEIIRGAMEIIPEGIRVIVISRVNTPDAFARMRSSEQVAIIDTDDLRLTEEETGGIMRLKVKKRFSKEAVLKIHVRAQGWAAGLVLMIEKARKGIDTEFFENIETETIFKYFTSEIFQKTDAETREFLLKTAFLPGMTVKMAEQLTGMISSERILAELTHNNYFTTRHSQIRPSYQYHPLFREFLLSKAKDHFNREDMSRLRKEAAVILEGSGEIENAYALFCDAGDREGIIRLIMTNAPRLLSEGRFRLVGDWIASIPNEISDNVPWLLYWRGICCMPFDPAESKACFEKAFHLFRQSGDTSGTLIAWAGIIESIEFMFDDFSKFDEWITVLEGLMHEMKEFPSPEIGAKVSSSMFAALVMRQPHHPDLDIWRDRALLQTDIRSRVQTLFYVAMYQIWYGTGSETGLIMDSLSELAHSPQAAPLDVMRIRMAETVYHNAVTGSRKLNLQAVNQGIELSEKSGIHYMDFMLLGNGAMAAFTSGDTAAATSFIRKIDMLSENLRPWDRALYCLVKCTEAWSAGDMQKAGVYSDQALKLAIRSGNPFSLIFNYILSAVVLQKLGEYEKADEYLEQVNTIERQINGTRAEFDFLVLKAYMLLNRGKDTRRTGIDYLRRAMTFGRENSVRSHLALYHPSVLTCVCTTALENEIEVAYVQDIIKSRNLVPETLPLQIENWPWPLKIYTLGRFGIFMDDKPVSSSGKVQKKPIEMLKALISLGGKDVREEQMTDLLWPEADGDAAHNVFKMTLSRLRQLYGSDNIIKMQDGRLTLNPGYCYVDAWVFERICNQVEALPAVPGRDKAMPDLDEITRLTEKAIALYRGHFLANENDRTWTLSIRERLRNKFIRLISISGQNCEQAGKFDRAAQYYRKGLDMDNLCEAFYQSLMKCYEKLGHRAEAILLYNNCRETFSTVLGISPSPETEALYKKIKK